MRARKSAAGSLRGVSGSSALAANGQGDHEQAGETLRASAADDAMERYARGDDRACVEVYELVKPPLYRFVVMRLRDVSLAEDIVQQTFLNIHRARGKFVEGGKVLPWAKTIACRLGVDATRARDRDGRWTEADIEECHGRPPGPDEEAAADEELATIRAAFSQLRPSQKVVLDYRARGLSLVEMAKALHTTVIAVKLRMHRATQRLRKSRR